MHHRHRRLARLSVLIAVAFAAFPTVGSSWAPQRPATAAAATRVEVRGFSEALVKQAVARPVPMIFVLKSGAGDNVASVMQTLERTGATNISSLSLVNGISADANPATLDALRYDAHLQGMQQDLLIKPIPIPDLGMLQDQLALEGVRSGVQPPPGQTLVSEPDTLSIIHADAVQKLYNGRDVRVAIIDTGIDLGQPDLQGVMLKGPDGKPLYKDFTNTDLLDTGGHGTAVAGTIAAQGKTVYSTSDTYPSRLYPPAAPGQRFNDQTYFTFSGVAPGVKLMVAKIFDSRTNGGAATTSNTVRAIQWAVQNHADIINESWGVPLPVDSGEDIVAAADEQAVKAGVTVVVSDGNAGPGQSTSGSPANAPDVIAAGASTSYRQYGETGMYTHFGAYTTDNIAAFTSVGPTLDGRVRPDVYAPGAWSWSTFPRYHTDDGPTSPPYDIGSFAGTSMAAPVTVGVVALVINAYRETHGGHSPSPAYVKQVLRSTADDLGYPAQEQSAGRVDALRAVQTVTRTGPSILLSGPLNLQGMPGTTQSQPIAVTNAGSTPEKVSFDPQVEYQKHSLAFSGTVVADDLVPYHFKVPAGTTELKASVNFDTTQNVPLPSGQASKNVVLNIVLYDPEDRMANWEQSSLPEFSDSQYELSGFVGTTVGKPEPGIWTAVVSQAPEQDAGHVRHFVNVPFSGHISLLAFESGGGKVMPASVTLRPGQSTHVEFRSDPLAQPGVSEVTLHVHELNLAATPVSATTAAAPTEYVATLPVVVTTSIPVKQGLGLFSGAFTGGVGTQGFGTEYKFYDFAVPNAASNLQVSVRWKDAGNLFLLALINPDGKTVNLVDNSLANSDGSINLSQAGVDSFQTNPLPGTWRLAFIALMSVGIHSSEPFIGAVVLNQQSVALNHSTVTVNAGGTAGFAIAVKNTGITEDAYYGYATTDQYTYLSLGGAGGVLQSGVALGAGATQALTYTTNFVPPGTKEVISQAESLNSSQPLDVELDDSVFGSFHGLAEVASVALGGQVSQGEAAIVAGKNNLPIGQYTNTISLPNTAHSGPTYVAASSQAFALSPQPWITLSPEQRFIDGSFSQQTVPYVAPQSTVTVHGTINVPGTVAPGTYHAHVFIYNVRDDQVADVPLTITVQAALPQPSPTPDPLLATIASTQYFPEGAAITGLTENMDLVNPGPTDAHVQLRVLNDAGWTTLNRYVVPAHGRRTVNVEPLVGNNQSIATIVQADQLVISGRQIIRNGAAGSYSVGTTSPSTHWYFADGYTVDSLAEFLTLVNTNARSAHVTIRFVDDQGKTAHATVTVGPASRSTISVGDYLAGSAVSATVTSNIPVVAERLQEFGSQGQGVTTTIGAPAATTSLYLDPGHLPKGTQAHISLFNPGTKDAAVSLSLIGQNGVSQKALSLKLKAGRRATVDLTAIYHTASLGALITSDAPIVAEKVAYYGNFKQAVVGGSDLMGVPAPATQLAFPGGTTAKEAADYLNIYNPNATPLAATITVIYHTNHTLQRTVQVPAGRRTSIAVASLGVPAGPSSLIVSSGGSEQFYATQTIFNAGRTDGSEVNGIDVSSQ